ncbi:putative holin [Bacillus phage phiAGATE]|uniref:Holin n=1 Tax=Bacillus phage phiAGATE TaxID=1204533 RepID=L0LC26_9CAUD|nr:holin [Bacillus phage phiAGATE]AGB62735.1 putative holin [Bacillus phage phiAGATE]
MENKKETVTQVVEVPTEAPKVEPKMVVLTIVYIVAIINAAAAYLGFDAFNLSVDSERLYEGVSLFFGVAAFVGAYWKNHDVSKSARIKAAAVKQVDVKKDKVN